MLLIISVFTGNKHACMHLHIFYFQVHFSNQSINRLVTIHMKRKLAFNKSFQVKKNNIKQGQRKAWRIPSPKT